jgi:hypothetical protein
VRQSNEPPALHAALAQPPLGTDIESHGAGGRQLEIEDPLTRHALAGRELWVAEL